MRAMYGMEGYGVFWAIIEALSRQPEMKLPFTELKLKSLTASFGQTFDLKQYIEDCAQLGLFRIEDGLLFFRIPDQAQHGDSPGRVGKIRKTQAGRQQALGPGRRRKGRAGAWAGGCKRIVRA